MLSLLHRSALPKALAIPSSSFPSSIATLHFLLSLPCFIHSTMSSASLSSATFSSSPWREDLMLQTESLGSLSLLCSKGVRGSQAGILPSQSRTAGKLRRRDDRKSAGWEWSKWNSVSFCKAVQDGRASAVNNVLGHSTVFHLFRLGLGFPGVGNYHSVNCVQGISRNEAHLTLSEASSGGADEEELLNITKGESLDNRSLRLVSGAYSLPHPDKVAKGGEDAYFVSSEEQALGVADGVGGWANEGVDAGLYARELMLQSMLAIRQEPERLVDLVRVLVKAHSRTYSRGSSTACILTLSEFGLQAANLGDSGFLIVRNGNVFFKSPPQQHAFNFPYQLGSESSDPPTAAELFSLKVDVGDIIIVGTDGLFDNLFDHDLKRIVLKSTQAGFGPGEMAKELADFARVRAQDPYKDSPFSTAAKFAGVPFYGGKLDDITVIVSFVTSAAQNSYGNLENS